MTELVKETVTTQENSASPVVSTQVKKVVTNSQTVERLVYFFFGVLEVFLAFRLIFKLMGASLGNAFVGLVYGVAGIFIFVAILVYGVLAWGIVKLIRIVR